MSFTIRLSQDLTAVEAGATAPLSIEITNKGEEVDRFEMQVEGGIDPEWTALPEPVVNIGPGETYSQKVFFKLPRTSESLAGNYPFVVKIRSLNSGDSRSAQGVLQIKPFHHLSMELNPKKGSSSPLRQQFPFSLTVMNLGNTEHTLQLTGADPEEECAYSFESDQVTVGPGQQKTVEASVGTASAGWVAQVHLFGFTITGRSLQNPNVTASTQGQLERRGLLSFGSILVCLLAVGALLLWLAARPQPPTISATVDSTTVIQGQSVQFHWKAAHSNSVHLDIQHKSLKGLFTREPITMDFPTEGSTAIVAASDDDTITVIATASSDHDKKATNPITISVRPVPDVPKPTITSFKVAHRQIKYGESFQFNFSYSSDVVRLTLSPSNQTVIPPITTLDTPSSHPGEQEYTLTAWNDKGGFTTKKITVEAKQESLATIDEFRADPPVVVAPDTKTVLSWKVSNAKLVQIDGGLQGVTTVNAVDSLPVADITGDMKYKLIATDSQGIVRSQVLTIKYKPLPPPSPTTAATTGSTGTPPTTTGATTGTTGGR